MQKKASYESQNYPGTDYIRLQAQDQLQMEQITPNSLEISRNSQEYYVPHKELQYARIPDDQLPTPLGF